MAMNLVQFPLLQYSITCELYSFPAHIYTLTSTAIQFNFEMTTATGDEAVAAGQAGGQTIFLPVRLNVEPNDNILPSDIVVSVTVTSGTATSKYHK